MFAIAALIVFILRLFKVTLGEVDLVVLGLALLAAHFAFGTYVPVLPVRRRE
jgi:hypothetical protein